MDRYIARYIQRRPETPLAAPKEYFRTVSGTDSLKDAMRQAERFTRKGFICVGMTSQEY